MLGRRHVGKLLGGMALAPLLAPRPAAAQKADDTLRITWRDALPDMDFYYNPQRTGFLLQLHVWDGLVYRDPDTYQLRPLLATAWKQVDPKTIDFTLRPGVTFHNGDPFGADDVVYTINTVVADRHIAVPSNYVFLESAQKLDDLTVRVTLARVFPAAMEYIAMVLPIWPKAYREALGPEKYSLAPVGTGPYRVTRVDPMTAIDLQRYDSYFAGSPKGKPAIRNIAITEVPMPSPSWMRCSAVAPTGSGISRPTSSRRSPTRRACRRWRPRRCASPISTSIPPAAPAPTIR